MGFFAFLCISVIIVYFCFKIILKETSPYAQEKVKKIRKFVFIGLSVFLLVILICSSIFFTNVKDIGFVETFGYPTKITTTGMHFKIPFVSKKYIYDGTTQGLAIGYSTDTNESVVEDSLMITKDLNFVNIDFYIEYKITDPIAFKYGSSDPIGILKNVASSAIRNTVGVYDIDPVLTTGKAEIQNLVYQDIIKELEKHPIGISVLNVSIQDSEPPKEVQEAFKAVETARQEAEDTINAATEYTNTQLPNAQAKAQEILQKAEATKVERINEAYQEVANFNALYNEYIQNPPLVKERIYYEAIEEVIPNLEIIIGKDSKMVFINNGNFVTE